MWLQGMSGGMEGQAVDTSAMPTAAGAVEFMKLLRKLKVRCHPYLRSSETMMGVRPSVLLFVEQSCTATCRPLTSRSISKGDACYPGCDQLAVLVTRHPMFYLLSPQARVLLKSCCGGRRSCTQSSGGLIQL